MAAIKTDNSKCMSWIHCNSCFAYYDESDRFYLVNCMHIFCYDCLNKRVITNNNKCCFCKKTVKYKKIDKTLDVKLLAALDPDPSKEFDSLVRSMELNVRQMTHLHGGIHKAEKQEVELNKLDRDMKADEAKISGMTAKVLAQNKVLEKMIADEERKREQQDRFMRCPPPRQEILSSSQNIRSGAVMGPPAIPRAPAFGGRQGKRPNVTRLSSISTGGNFY